MKLNQAPGVLFIVLLLVPLQTARPQRSPVIDMHLHAERVTDFPDFFGRGDLRKPATDEALLQETLLEMDRYNVVKAVTSGPLDIVEVWKAAAPDRIISSPFFPRFGVNPDLKLLRQSYLAGQLGAMGEIAGQYEGLSPSDRVLEPYLALAEELDIPVGIHMGMGPPGATYTCCPKYRAALGNPLLLEEALVRHPKLRAYIMHAGYPLLEEAVALMRAHPQVYADLAVINWILPRAEFHSYLRRLIRAGLGKRLMFGSDQMVWPEAIGMAIEGIESADFLTKAQKQDIFYNNAVRFLRLDQASSERSSKTPK